ncbi:class F sortase [Streptomyces piniterrae]|uniref:Class F sortase n=1 Tax=Streptomyces piniterrae TaxID=2571125 RepID=A0A4U0N836_9ACTN|nr:class F sortase [Streptomyces piniterrae]TJZ49562.1 class F sortase [Streptomyces piniterrae]
MSPLGEPEERHPETPGSHRPRWGVIALLALTGFALVRNGLSDQAEGPPQPGGGARPISPAESRPDASGPAPLTRSAAARVAIPSLKVSAPVVPLGLDKDGWIAAPPPENRNLAGWYADGPAPGENGTAVIVGHVDNVSGPAVFFGLGSLKKGSTIRVTRKDGRAAAFEVYGIQVFAKKDFPSARVYRATGRPELRVLTCGGGYSASAGYTGNVVVFARMTGVS